MDALLYWLARSLLGFLQLWPLGWVARIGRGCGALAFWLDARHRRVAIGNVTRCFGDRLEPKEVRALVRENFKRLGENYASAVKTSAMTDAELGAHLEWIGLERVSELSVGTRAPWVCQSGAGSCVVAIGHFGNFELYARPPAGIGKIRIAATYRGLRQPGLDRLMQSLRNRAKCLFFERRRDAAALKRSMAGGGLCLGLLADQHAGDNGLWLPFLGSDCSTSAAPALLAQRYGCPLFTAVCYRVGSARWRVEMGPEIPTMTAEGKRREPAEIMREVNSAFEAAIARDPANWFWVHKRWKPRSPRSLRKNAFSDALVS